MELWNSELMVYAILILISGVGGWLAFRRRKLKLEEGLGRKVMDEEVNSISAWMKADDKVLNEVVHEDNPEQKVESAMEDAATNYASELNTSRVSLSSLLKRETDRTL